MLTCTTGRHYEIKDFVTKVVECNRKIKFFFFFFFFFFFLHAETQWVTWRLGHENVSTAILPFPLIQEEQLSVTGERMCTKYW